ncbi:S8 family serine peptidase [Thermococcus celer]|uniref:Subtilisin-like serine protease n=1 Tax=Thermococcus celer Vu 13 = JCM 8558 TaxID=1293037 RepID=A0A218P1P2_THECE|nr:S8 family serine peptidase [Thermococcus celer]ASI98849.1 alkaline serine protease [Thermococcus celer Vu 13 = JCM 8558]
MKRLGAVVLALVLVGLLAGTALAAPVKPVVRNNAVQQKNYGLLTPGLFKKVQRMNWNQEVDTVIMFGSYGDRDRAVKVLRLMGAQVKYSYKIIPAVAVKIKARDLLLIAGMIDTGYFGNTRVSGIKFIQEDYKVQVDDATSVSQIGADTVWNSLGYDGSGVVVAIVDTGIDANHPDLKGKVIGWYDAVNGRSTPYDDQGHGTHVAGIVAGTGSVNSQYIGVAPGAKLVGVKVLGADGSGSVSTIIAGVDWVVQNKDKYGIRVINLSLGSSQSSDGTDSLSQAVNNAWDAGIVVCVAAGNSGPNTYTVGSPAAASKVITVGAVDSNDNIASFSSRGPTADGRLKPEVVAPGVDIIAPRASGTSMGTPINDYYTKASGTSMATPHVSGVAALILQAHPSWTPDKVKTALIETADIVAPKEIADIAYGAGRVNVYKAIKYDDYAKLTFTGSVADKGSATHTFDVSGATFVTATLYWDTGSSDIDLYLYDPNGNEVDYSYTAYYGFEKVGYYNPTAGTWTVKVVSYKGAANYQVDVVSDGSLSQSGGGNPNPNPNPNPTPTTDTQTFTGSVNDYWDTSDTFTMNVNSGATKITGDLTFDTSYNDLDLYLYDPNGNLVDRSTSSNSYEHVEYANPAPGTWTFLVYAYSTYGWADYQLKAVVYYG